MALARRSLGPLHDSSRPVGRTSRRPDGTRNRVGRSRHRRRIRNRDQMSSKDNEDFVGKVAFVTGAGSGIGRATAIAFAAAGANVIAADRNSNDNNDTVELIISGGGNAIATTCDV